MPAGLRNMDNRRCPGEVVGFTAVSVHPAPALEVQGGQPQLILRII